jgi:polyhydroxyalkanoate synthesis regulator phasin
MKNIKEEILLQLEKPMNDITIRIIESEKAHYLKQMGRELTITPHMEKMIRLSLVIDLMKALQNYILPTDTLEQMNWYEGAKGIEIHARINRNEETHYFMTEAITAGGYNIQRFHYRYITKTKMPRVMSDLAKEYVEEQKKMNKIERLENELKGLTNRLEEKQNEFNTYSVMSREELIEAMKEDTMFAWRYEAWETRGDVEVLEDGIRSMKNWHIEWPKRDIKNITKQIAKLEVKINNLK